MNWTSAQSLIACMTAALTFAPACATAQHDAHSSHALGTVDFPVSCSDAARTQFNHAVALLHHMTYPEANEAFRQVTTLDPDCAMGHWGIAMTLFQPLWPTRPDWDALQQGWQAVQTAKSLQPPTLRERLFIEAAEAFYTDPESLDYWLRIRRWEAAMAHAHAAYPDDPEVSAFYALAHLAAAPVTLASRAHHDEAAAILLRVYEENPHHPGAMHYIVHANDVPGRERKSLEIVRKYETAAPDNPHALHMPTHIYTRLGEWHGVIRGNLLAADAALNYPVGKNGDLVWDEFPHAIEYLVYAYLQVGEDGKALDQIRRLRATQNLEPSFKTAFHLSSIPARYALERQAWEEAVHLTARPDATLDWNRFKWPEAITWFAIGLGAMHVGNAERTQECLSRLIALEASTREQGEELFARNIGVLRLAVNAWLAQLRNESTQSVRLMREAAALERGTPKHAVTPAPTLPAYELLGDLLLMQQRPAEALTAYRQSLLAYPGRFNTLLGAARAARATNDVDTARSFYQALLDLAGNGTRLEATREALRYLDR